MATATRKDTGAPKTDDLRDRLKALIGRELERLPETLELLEPKDRLGVLVRLMPFVFPKVESVRPDRGEKGTPFGDWE